MMLMMLSLQVATAQEPVQKVVTRTCQSTSEEWMRVVETTLDAFQEMEMAEFEESRDKAHDQIKCLGEVASKEALVLFHRMEMMNAFVNKDKATFGAHAQAAYWIEPTFTLERQALVNEGHPINQWNAFAIEQVLGAPISLPTPLQGQIYVNGDARVDVPSDLPYIFQYIVDSEVVLNQFVEIDEPIPVYPIAEPLHWQFPLTLDITSPYTMASAGLLTAALLSTTISYRKHQRFWNPATPIADLTSLKRGVNVWSTLALLSGTAAIGTGVYQVYQQEAE